LGYLGDAAKRYEMFPVYLGLLCGFAPHRLVPAGRK
jgi:hypothetical protein